MNKHQANILMAGFGGQGIVVIGNIIARACVIENKNVTGMVSYGAEMRGGTANATVIISDEDIACPFVTHPTHTIFLNHPSLERFEPDIVDGGLMLLNTSLMQRPPERDDLQRIEIAATDIAHELGNLRVANIVALGAFVHHTKLVSMESIMQGLQDLFGSKKPELVSLNLKALQTGAERSVLIPAVQASHN
ncbi:MAG: 2-oxoacid:acceptor oxidoreductase family protein [Planctomycetes bacterium]|nr:2-oxoacid:acceptor oxidoreductase family protein [Planctomycetota bacterium]